MQGQLSGFAKNLIAVRMWHLTLAHCSGAGCTSTARVLRQACWLQVLLLHDLRQLHLVDTCLQAALAQPPETLPRCVPHWCSVSKLQRRPDKPSLFCRMTVCSFAVTSANDGTFEHVKYGIRCYPLQLLCRAYGERFLYDDMLFTTAFGQLLTDRVNTEGLQQMLQ